MTMSLGAHMHAFLLGMRMPGLQDMRIFFVIVVAVFGCTARLVGS